MPVAQEQTICFNSALLPSDGRPEMGCFQPFSRAFRAAMKLLTKPTIDRVDVAIIRITRISPAPPVAKDFGSRIPSKATSVSYW